MTSLAFGSYDQNSKQPSMLRPRRLKIEAVSKRADIKEVCTARQ